VKLGLKPPIHDPRLLKLDRYMVKMPEPPPATNWQSVIKGQWGMFANDVIGNCTIAGAAHLKMAWTANAHHPFVPSTKQVIAEYSRLSGYDPVTGEHDDGLMLSTVLKWWRKRGLFGSKIGAYGAVSSRNLKAIKNAIHWFGGVYIGVDMPLAWQGKAQWRVPSNGMYGDGLPGSWGGHCCESGRYDSSHIWPVTWGTEIPADWGVAPIYFGQVVAIVSEDFLEDDNRTPDEFDLTQLRADLKAVTS
jgi:hypothetical protein